MALKIIMCLCQGKDQGWASGLMCLNAEEEIHFQRLEGKRYLEGLKVEDGLQRLHDFCRELVSYLNVPQMGSQER